MQVRTGGAAFAADVADDVAAMDVLTGGDGECGEMSVKGVDAVAVIEPEQQTVGVR